MRTGTLRLLVLLVASFFLLISWGASAQETPTPDPLLTAISATEQPVVPIEPSLLPPPILPTSEIIPSPVPVPTVTDAPLVVPTPSETATATQMATASPTWIETLVATITGETLTPTPLPQGEGLTPTATGSGTPTASWTPTLEGTLTETATFLPTLTLDFPTPVRTLMPEPVMPEIEAIGFDAPYVSDWDYAEEVLEPRDSGFALRFRSPWYVRSRVPEQNDIILTASVRMTGGRFSIYTHVTDIAWYRFAVSADGLVELYRGEQVVVSASIGAIPDTWITVRFSSTSGNLRASVQGVEVLTFADDAPLPPGKVWLGVDGIPEGEIWADNLAVSGFVPMPEIVPPVVEPEIPAAPEGLSTTTVTEVIAFDYLLNTAGNYAIYTISPSGTGLTNLTSDWTNSAELDPVLSPDGSKIAFVSNRNPQGGSTIDYNIWVMDSDGTDRRQITAHSANDYSPTWRRDGQALAFVSNRNGNESIFVIGVNETSSQAGVFAAVGKDPDYSPVNDELAFSVYNGGTGTNDIYIINAPANPYFVASAPYAADFEPTWSNNGNEILFRALAPAPNPLPGMNNWIYYTSRLTGPWLTTNITNSNTQYGPIKPDYSPNGAQMVAWYDTGLHIANMSPIPLIFARINQTNYNTNNPDWGIFNPPPEIPPGTGLLGAYHNNIDLSLFASSRIDPTVNFGFADNPSLATSAGITNIHFFSVRWSGFVGAPYTGSYTFTVTSDDGSRLTINGVPLITNWGPHPGTPLSGTIQLQAGQLYPLILDYRSQQPGGAKAELRWSLGGQITEQIIPQRYLYPPETCPSGGFSGTPEFCQAPPTATPTPTATPNPDHCLTTLTDSADVFATIAAVTILANGGSVTAVETLANGTSITVTAIHPNREYARINYTSNEQSRTGWARVRTNSTDALRFNVTNCDRSKIEALVNTGIGLLPTCTGSQIVGCNPPSPSSNLLSAPRTTIATWGDTTNGCSNVRCPNPPLPCPLLPTANNQHCGVDLTSSTSPNVYAAGLYTGGAGMFCSYGASGTIALRKRMLVNGSYQIWEYQYTHVAIRAGLSDDLQFGEYIAAESLLGQYDVSIGNTGGVAHVHVVIKVFADLANSNFERLCAATTVINPPGYLNPFNGSVLP